MYWVCATSLSKAQLIFVRVCCVHQSLICALCVLSASSRQRNNNCLNLNNKSIFFSPKKNWECILGAAISKKFLWVCDITSQNEQNTDYISTTFRRSRKKERKKKFSAEIRRNLVSYSRNTTTAQTSPNGSSSTCTLKRLRTDKNQTKTQWPTVSGVHLRAKRKRKRFVILF